METQILTLFGVAGTIASIIGLLYAFIVARRSDRRKLLTYHVTPPLPIASVLPDKAGHRLSIIYEREGTEPLNVKGAYLRFVRICNFGKEPIRRDDIAASDPLRLEIEHARILDLAVADVSRKVINFQITPNQSNDGGATSTQITFDFLDYLDGAGIRVLTDRPRTSIRLLGTIIGIPGGLPEIHDLQKNPILDTIGCGAAIILELIAIASGLYLYSILAGGLTSLWLSLIPVVALLLPIIVIALIGSTIWPRGPQWPKALVLPHWFESASMHNREYFYEREFEYERVLRERRKTNRHPVRVEKNT